MPCNFEVNLITPLGVVPLFSSFFSSPDLVLIIKTFLKFDEKRAITSRWEFR
jgi:hypothetical protein